MLWRKKRKRRSDGLLHTRKVMIDWDSHEFHPVVDMPEDYAVFDLSKGTWTPPKTEYSIGKYDDYDPDYTLLNSSQEYNPGRYSSLLRCIFGLWRSKYFSVSRSMF